MLSKWKCPAWDWSFIIQESQLTIREMSSFIVEWTTELKNENRVESS